MIGTKILQAMLIAQNAHDPVCRASSSNAVPVGVAAAGDQGREAALLKYVNRLHQGVQLKKWWDSWYPFCDLCSKWADEMHMRSKDHQKRWARIAPVQTTSSASSLGTVRGGVHKAVENPGEMEHPLPQQGHLRGVSQGSEH